MAQTDSLTMYSDSSFHYKEELAKVNLELLELKGKIKELEISKSYFDIIVNSQWNTFSTFLAVILGTLGIAAGIQIFKDYKISFKEIPDMKKKLEQIANDLKSFRSEVNEVKFNANRAFYLGHLNRENHDWATIAAMRSMELSLTNKDVNGILSWLKSAKRAFDKADDNQKARVKRDFKDEINKRIDKALELHGIEDPDFYSKLKQFKKIINE